MMARSFNSGIIFYIAVAAILIGISATAYAQEDSAIKIIPKGTLVCLKLSNLWEFDGKVMDLLDSLNIPDAPNVSIAPFLGQMVGAGIGSFMDLEDSGFNIEGNFYVFWTVLAPDKFSIVVPLTDKEIAEETVSYQMGGTEEKHRGITYVTSKAPYAWAILDDVFIYSKDKKVIMEAINTHLKETPSILSNEKYTSSVSSLRSGDIAVYIDLDYIVSTFMPILQAQSQKMVKDISSQMKQSKAKMPQTAVDPAKILNIEFDLGLWLIQQFKSYAIALGIGKDGIWVNDSLKFKPDSPISDYLDIAPSELEIIKSLPSDVMMAGGATLHAASLEKLNVVMLKTFLPLMQEKMTTGQVSELQKKYETVTRDILSCFGDEMAFAMFTRSDKVMPRVAYIIEIADKAKALETICNVDYISEMSKPFYEAFGMDMQMASGPSQRYSGIQIKSIQMDFSSMAQLVPNGAEMYPEKIYLWYAFVGNKLVYAISQSAENIKMTIDAINGRRSCIVNSPGFEDINIRLPEQSNSTVYVSPTGYLKFVMGIMMSQMGQKPPSGAMDTTMKAGMGFAVSTTLYGDSVSNFSYFLAKEIQELINTAKGFNQMMKPPQ